MTFRISPEFPKGRVVNLAGSASSVSSARGALTVKPQPLLPDLSIVSERFSDTGFTSVWKYLDGYPSDWHGFFDIDG